MTGLCFPSIIHSLSRAELYGTLCTGGKVDVGAGVGSRLSKGDWLEPGLTCSDCRIIGSFFFPILI